MMNVNLRTVQRVVKEYIENGNILRKPKRTRVTKYDDFDENLVIRRIRKFVVNKEVQTLQKLLNVLKKENPDFKFSRSTLWRVLRKNGFRYKMTTDNRKMITERKDVVTSRNNYLPKIKEYRDSGYNIVYTDETWVNSNHSVGKQWIGPGGSSAQIPPSDNGRRLELLHAGSALGFVDGACLLFEAEKKADYHDEMDSEKFLRWLQSDLIPGLERPSVLVLDNASYHNTKHPSSCSPTMASKKQLMVDWLRDRGIEFPITATKKDLFEMIKINKPPVIFNTDAIAHRNGHLVLRTPVACCELNPIELIWASIKGRVARRNQTFKLSDVKRLLQEAIDDISAADWENAVKHVINIEEDYWERDALQDAVRPIIIPVGDDNDESSDNSL